LVKTKRILIGLAGMREVESLPVTRGFQIVTSASEGTSMLCFLGSCYHQAAASVESAPYFNSGIA
jgi:hypothetical protein